MDVSSRERHGIWEFFGDLLTRSAFLRLGLKGPVTRVVQQSEPAPYRGILVLFGRQQDTLWEVWAGWVRPRDGDRH